MVLYLCLRKSTLAKVPSSLTNLAMFGIPLVSYVAIGTTNGTNFAMTIWQWVVLVLAAVVFAYGGNTVSLKAIEIAPNPGYSLVLSKSYVLFTTVAAVTLLHADLTLKKALAILVIVGFSALIMVNPKEAKQLQNNRWVVLSFGAFFAWGMLSLSSKYLFTHGVDTFAFLIALYAIVTVCIVASNKMTHKTFRHMHKDHWLLLLGTGVFSTVFNIGNFEAIRLAPNVGYVNAINAGSIAMVTIFAVVLFKDELTRQKALGVLGVTAGLLLLLL